MPWICFLVDGEGHRCPVVLARAAKSRLVVKECSRGGVSEWAVARDINRGQSHVAF